MNIYIRQLTIADKPECIRVETAAFPPAEAATPEKIDYRLTACPELCYGLFITPDATASSIHGPIPVIGASQVSGPETLVAHTISTRSRSKVVTDDDMKVPENWQADPKAAYNVGHQPDGRSVALHALAVDPHYQRVGLGKTIMKAYIEQIGNIGGVDRISILTYDRLVDYYKKLGFTHYGKSESNYAGVEWHDLAYEYSA